MSGAGRRLGSLVAVVGAGASGLACAVRLRELGLAPRVFEASDGVGGRVRTDTLDGFRLDRGFQVLPLAYPEVRRFLDLDRLRVGRFLPGARVRLDGRFERVADPLRAPGAALAGLFARVGSLGDKLRVLRLGRASASRPLHPAGGGPETTALEALRAAGLSARMIDGFFRPFLGGIFLEPELSTSSRFLDFVMTSFATGNAALPAGGMGAVCEQLAARLPRGCVRLRAPVRALDGRGLVLASGERVDVGAVVVATDGPAAARLAPGLAAPAMRGVLCLWFDAPRPPVDEPVLVLSGEPQGPVNNVCVPSLVAEGYAPPGRSLVSVSVLEPRREDDAGLERAVRSQLAGWFGPEVSGWRLLRIDRIAAALPACPPPASSADGAPLRLGERRFACGDHRGIPSLETAFRAGRLAAEAVAAAAA
jgi:phytoene dehydrogenase-like protein